MFLPSYLDIAPSLIKLGKNIVKSKDNSNTNTLAFGVVGIFTDKQKRVIEEVSEKVEESFAYIILFYISTNNSFFNLFI